MGMIHSFLVIFVSFAGGLAVGSGFVAFLAVLGVIPRLMQLLKTNRHFSKIEFATISGAIVGCYLSLRGISFSFPNAVIAFIGLLSGIFIGMLAAALTEILNVWPILVRRVGVEQKLLLLLMALVFGKVFGSLFHWIYFVQP
ncbi:MAG: stage V sporulation protein AB [Bacillaceae bacterium]